MTQESFKKHIVIGAGIAGLTAATELQDSGEDFLLFEKSSELGGSWQSKNYESSVYELGPNTVIDKSEALRDLIKKAGLESQLLRSELKSSLRYFYRANQFLEVSTNPLKLLFSKLLGLKAKLRIFAEPFLRTKSDSEESVHDFFTRRFGYDFAQYLLAPAMQGIWGGDIRQLNMSAAMPKIFEKEQDFGSVILGFLFGKKKKNPYSPLSSLSFKNGLQELCTELGNYIQGERVKTQAELIKVEKEGGLFKVLIKRGQNQDYYFCENLHLATPAFVAAKALTGLNTELSKALSDIYYAPMVLVVYSIKKSFLEGKEDAFKAFGFLNTNKSHFTLGTIFSSSLFPERELEDEVLFTSFLGGSRNPQILDFEEEEVRALALNEAKEIFDNALGLNLELDNINFIDSKFIAKAIPQYNDQYLKSKQIIKAGLRSEQGLFLLGNYMNGVSIVETIESSSREGAIVKT